MRGQPTKVQTGRGKRIAIFLTSIAVLIGVIAIVWMEMVPNMLSKDKFVAPPFDANALSGEPKPAKEFGYDTVQAVDSFRFMLDSSLWQQEDSSVFVHFTNPEDTNIWMMVEIVDENNQSLYKSGMIKNGEYVEKLEPLTDLSDEPYNITILVYGFEPQTYYSMGIVKLSTVLQNKS